MLLKHLVIDRLFYELRERPTICLILEDAVLILKTASHNPKKINAEEVETLADIITTIKLLTNSDYRSAMTRQEVGINPNKPTELLKMLDSIPSDPSKPLSAQTKRFVQAVASMSKKARDQERNEIKALLDPDSADSKSVIDRLKVFAEKTDQALIKLRAKITAR